MSRASWYGKLFGGLFRSRSAPVDNVLSRLKAIQGGRRASRIAAEEIRKATQSQSLVETPYGGPDDTAYNEQFKPKVDPFEELRKDLKGYIRKKGDEAYDQTLADLVGDIDAEWETDFTSSNVQAYRFHAKQGKLEVKFLDGSHYAYEGVGAAVFARLRAAGSKGKFIKHHIETVYFYYEVSTRPRRYRKYPDEYLGPKGIG